MIFIAQEKEFKLEDKIQVLYFYAPWMIYHKKMMVMFDKVEQIHSNLDFFAFDTDEFKSQCIRFKIKSIPTVVVLNNGKEISRLEGLPLTSAFKKFFADICKIGEENNGKERK